jgi:hypothetical protein
VVDKGKLVVRRGRKARGLDETAQLPMQTLCIDADKEVCMPYVIPRPRIRRALLACIGAAVLTGAVPAIADACTVSTSGSPVFKSFGDLANYAPVQNGAFEGSTSGWSLTGSAMAAGNESFYVHGAGDTRSLSINPNGVAVSPPVCVGIATPSFRFVARRTSGSWAQMNVNLLWTDAAGVAHTTTAGSVGGSTGWALAPVMNLGSTLPLWQSGDTLTVRIQFLPAQYGGAWSIDDVYIDPYSRG